MDSSCDEGFQYTLESAKNGLPNIVVLTDKRRNIHSSYDPVREADTLVKSWPLAGRTKVIIYGLGLGYHVEACLRQNPLLQQIFVIEPNQYMIQAARAARTVLFNEVRLHVIPASSALELAKIISEYSLDAIFIHPASVEICPYSNIKALLQEALMIRQTIGKAEEILMNNWNANSGKIETGNVFNGQRDRYAGQPGIVVAAGPSLDKNVVNLRALQYGDNVMLAVGAVLKRLLRQEVFPTACVLSDGGPIVMKHIDHLYDKISLPPLLLLSTAYRNVCEAYDGEISWILQSGFSPAQHFAQNNGYDLFHTGGSVATLCLDILYYWGCNPIIFVGQDLAYLKGQSHAIDTNHSFMNGTGHGFRNVTVKSVFGDYIPTTITWNSFRHWIEEFIRQHPDRAYINTSEGAEIKGTKYLPLDDVLKTINHKRL